MSRIYKGKNGLCSFLQELKMGWVSISVLIISQFSPGLNLPSAGVCAFSLLLCFRSNFSLSLCSCICFLIMGWSCCWNDTRCLCMLYAYTYQPNEKQIAKWRPSALVCAASPMAKVTTGSSKGCRDGACPRASRFLAWCKSPGLLLAGLCCTHP